MQETVRAFEMAVGSKIYDEIIAADLGAGAGATLEEPSQVARKNQAMLPARMRVRGAIQLRENTFDVLNGAHGHAGKPREDLQRGRILPGIALDQNLLRAIGNHFK